MSEPLTKNNGTIEQTVTPNRKIVRNKFQSDFYVPTIIEPSNSKSEQKQAQTNKNILSPRRSVTEELDLTQ